MIRSLLTIALAFLYFGMPLHGAESPAPAKPATGEAAQMRPVANRGRATPQDALQTLAYAASTKDLDLLGSFIVYRDDTPAARVEFMANFNAAVRERYRTPERLMAAFSWAAWMADSPVAVQITETREFNDSAQTVSARVQHASGRGDTTILPFQKTAHGWALASVSLRGKNNLVKAIQSRLNTVTGNISLPPKK